MVSAIEGIMGMNSCFDGLGVNYEWIGFTVKRDYMGKRLSIKVVNDGSQKGASAPSLTKSFLSRALYQS
jgi:hypothetical protein